MPQRAIQPAVQTNRFKDQSDPWSSAYGTLNPQMLEELGRFYQRGNLPDREDRLDVNRPLSGEDFGDLLPPPPTRFQSHVTTIGSPSFARAAEELLNVDPRVKFNTRRVTAGPESEMMRSTDIFPAKPEDSGYPGFFRGHYDIPTGEATVHPLQLDKVRVLVHELAHGAGHAHPNWGIKIGQPSTEGTEGTREAENIFKMYYPAPDESPSQGTRDFQRQIRKWNQQDRSKRAVQPSNNKSDSSSTKSPTRRR